MAVAPPGDNVPGGVFDALRVKIREEAVVRNKAVYLALGVMRDGFRTLRRVIFMIAGKLDFSRINLYVAA